MTRFDLIYTLGMPAIVPWLTWRRLHGKYRESAGGMMGARLPRGAEAAAFAGGSLWVHAVSVGEVAAARAVAPGLERLAPGLPLVVSTVTETGQAAARRTFPQASVTYFPLDFSFNVRRFQAAFNPRLFVLMETELWPNFLALAAARGTRCFMLNAKISDRSFPRYRRLAGFLRPALAALEGVATQTAADAERFAALGVAPGRIRVAGNCKFDLEPPSLTHQERAELAARLGLDPGRRWIVAGSTHPGEETLMLDALRAVRARVPEAALLLCPRHPERFAEAARLAAEAGFTTTRASEAAAGEASARGAAGADVVVLDQMGVLARAYGLGEIAIVAGSFCPVGGHNLLEAAVHAVPVLYGPDMHSQREIHRLFEQSGAGWQVAPEALAGALTELLTSETLRREHGARALAATERNRGAAARGIAAMAEWLGSSSAPLCSGVPPFRRSLDA